MTQQTQKITRKIQIIANRVRCANCNAVDDVIYIVEDDLRFRASWQKPTLLCPIFIRGNPRKLRINRNQALCSGRALVRVCLVCGTSRKTSIANI